MEVSKIDDESQLMISATVKFPSFSSVLCELVNNSLNAQADYIEVQILSSENKLIVKDNGLGFDTFSLTKDFLSKSSKSLFLLQKISKMSVFTFRDRCHSLKNGKISESRALNKQGTVIFIENLYFNVPVRSMQIKKTLVFDCFSGIEELLISQPEVCIKIFFDDEEIASFDQVSDIRERLLQISGCQELKFVRFYGKSADIEGFITGIESCILHKRYQFVINDEVLMEQPDISNRINNIYLEVEKILKETKNKKFPVFYLKFSNKNRENCEYWLFECLNDLTLMLKEQIFNDSVFQRVFYKFLSSPNQKRGKPEWVESKSYTFTSAIDDQELLKTLELPINHESTLTTTLKKDFKKASNLNFSYKNFDDSSIKSTIKAIFPSNLQDFSFKTNSNPSQIFNLKQKTLLKEDIEINELLIQDVIGQIDNKFIAANIKTDSSTIFTVFDQHASHERVRLEELLRTLKEGLSKEKCKVFVKLTAEDVARYEKRKEVCEGFGFLLKKEGQNYFLVSLPVIFGTVLNLEDFLTTVHSDGDIPKPVLDVLKFKACRSAVKFGDHLEYEQAVCLVNDLGKCKVFNQCAHGRPTFYPLIKVPEKVFRGKLDYSRLKLKS